ncbi:MAG TPA: CDP-archaeol synthase [Plasticicumulans sp.]|nr:CDP-archaeol synthase [Plasticicumulans sp.]
MIEALQLLFLLFVANGAPILATRVLDTAGDHPIDGGHRFLDGRPLFGPSKTWRGLGVALLASTLAALLLGWPAWIGLLIGAAAMLGDLLSSFLKRRLGLASSAQALGIDQVPEALLPLLAVRETLALDGWVIAALVAAFVVLELLLSRLLYRLHIRRQPY